MSDLPKIGIDIGTKSIKLVELIPSGRGKWRMTSAASMPTPAGGLSGSGSNASIFSGALVKIIKEMGAKSRRVVASLPEDEVSSHVVEMPSMNDDEVKQALQWQVEQYIPIPADKAVWSHQIIRKDKAGGGMEVLLAAVPKNLVSLYTQIIEGAGLEVLALETELMATSRAVVADDNPLALIVDIGAKATDMGIVSHGQMVFSRTISAAGEAFTRAVESSLNLDTATAEMYKGTYGFSPDKLEGKLFVAMKPVLTIIANEIKKTIDFYSSKHAGETVKMVVLGGGVATLPDIVGALSGMVGVEMIIGNPFAKVAMEKDLVRAVSGMAPFYTVAVGLAMRPAQL